MPRFGLSAIACALLGSILLLVGLGEHPNSLRVTIDLILLVPAIIIFGAERLRITER
jgi:hypothetical protein